MQLIHSVLGARHSRGAQGRGKGDPANEPPLDPKVLRTVCSGEVWWRLHQFTLVSLCGAWCTSVARCYGRARGYNMMDATLFYIPLSGLYWLNIYFKSCAFIVPFILLQILKRTCRWFHISVIGVWVLVLVLVLLILVLRCKKMSLALAQSILE